jgi:hypothetical protein
MTIDNGLSFGLIAIVVLGLTVLGARWLIARQSANSELAEVIAWAQREPDPLGGEPEPIEPPGEPPYDPARTHAPPKKPVAKKRVSKKSAKKTPARKKAVAKKAKRR